MFAWFCMVRDLFPVLLPFLWGTLERSVFQKSAPLPRKQVPATSQCSGFGPKEAGCLACYWVHPQVLSQPSGPAIGSHHPVLGSGMYRIISSQNVYTQLGAHVAASNEDTSALLFVGDGQAARRYLDGIRQWMPKISKTCLFSRHFLLCSPQTLHNTTF